MTQKCGDARRLPSEALEQLRWRAVAAVESGAPLIHRDIGITLRSATAGRHLQRWGHPRHLRAVRALRRTDEVVIPDDGDLESVPL